MTRCWREEASNRRSLSQTSRLSDGTRDAVKRMCSLSSTERERTRRWLPCAEKICPDLKNTGAPLTTSPFGRVKNRRLVREIRVLDFGHVAPFSFARVHRIRRPGLEWPRDLIDSNSAPPALRISLLASDESDNVSFRRTVALDISLSH